MRSKTLALVSTPRTSSLSTGTMLEPTEQPDPMEAAEAAHHAPHRRHEPAPLAAVPTTGASTPPQWASEHLLAGAEEATITHGDQVYRLRRTLTGKLILTK